MKHWLTAAAAAPLLIACASSGAETAAKGEDAQARVLIVNGERIVLNDGRDAAAAIEAALAEAEHSGPGRFVVAFDAGPDPAVDAADRARFAREMAEMAAAMEQAFGGEFDFDFHFNAEFDGDPVTWSDEDSEGIDIMAGRVEREAQRRAERFEREAERMERQAERVALRIERQAARAELNGLRAGVAGMEEGLDGVNTVLERGWVHDWSGGERERVALTAERRAELEETRAELLDSLERLRADLAQAEARHAGDGHREVRIVRRDGEVRGRVNEDEATGSELERLLEGAPDAPEPPSRPD